MQHDLTEELRDVIYFKILKLCTQCCTVLFKILYGCCKRNVSLYWNFTITVQRGSADTVVRAMNAFNGKCHFRGMPAPRPIDFQKNGTVDYVGDPSPHARIGVNRFKGGVSAHE